MRILLHINWHLNIYIILDILTTLLALYILFLYFGIFLKKKKLNFTNVIICSLYLLWQILGVNVIAIPMYIRLLVTIILVLMVCENCYIEKLRIKIIISLLISAIWTLMEFLVGYLFIMCDLNYKILQLSGAFLSKILTLILVIGLRKFYKNKSIHKLPIKYSITLLMIPVGSLYLIYNIFEISINNTSNSTIKFSIIGLLIILVINITVFYLYVIILRELDLQSYNTLYIQQIQLYNIHMAEKEYQVKMLRKERHDTKQHYLIMQAMTEQEHYIELKQYLSELVKQVLSAKKEISKTENLVVDALVNNKLEILQKDGVTIITDIHVPIKMRYEAADIGILLGNILDNATEAVGKNKEEKYIKLFIKYESVGLFITCINSYDGVINRNKSGEIISRKIDNENHGFGLFSINIVAEKYKGTVVYNSNDKEFTIKVFLPAK